MSVCVNLDRLATAGRKHSMWGPCPPLFAMTAALVCHWTCLTSPKPKQQKALVAGFKPVACGAAPVRLGMCIVHL